MKWAKTIIPNKEWSGYCSQISAYTFLRRTSNGVEAGFASGNELYKSEEITDIDDLRRIDLHRRQTNQRPFPLLTDDEMEDK